MTKYQYKKFYDNLKTLGEVKDVTPKCTIDAQIDSAAIDMPISIFMFNKDGVIVTVPICCESEEALFKRAMEEERAKGLVDFKLSITDDPEIKKTMTVESLCAEINRAREAPSLPETDLKGDCIPPNKTSYGTVPLETVKKNVAEFQSNVKRIGGLKDSETHFKNDGDKKGMLEAIERHVATSKRQVDALALSQQKDYHHDSGTVCMMAGGAC